MTDQVNEQLAVIRQSVLESAFKHYHELVNFLKKIPVNQQLPGMQRAYGYIDDGMLWVKEILNTCPIILPAPEKNVSQEEMPEAPVESIETV